MAARTPAPSFPAFPIIIQRGGQRIQKLATSRPWFFPINSLRAEVEREVHVAHVPEVLEDVPHVLDASAKGQVADEEGHLARRARIPPAIAAVVPPVPAPVAVTTHGVGVAEQ